MEIEDLAEQLNMSYNRLNHRLNNKVQFKLGEVIKLARILNISNPDILFSKQHPI